MATSSSSLEGPTMETLHEEEDQGRHSDFAVTLFLLRSVGCRWGESVNKRNGQTNDHLTRLALKMLAS